MTVPAAEDEVTGRAVRLLEYEAAKRYLSVAVLSVPEQGFMWRVKLVDKYYYDATPEHCDSSLAAAADKCRAALLADGFKLMQAES